MNRDIKDILQSYLKTKFPMRQNIYLLYVINMKLCILDKLAEILRTLSSNTVILKS